MRAVGIKELKNRLSEYVRIAAAGERVLVTDRDILAARDLLWDEVRIAVEPAERCGYCRAGHEDGQDQEGNSELHGSRSDAARPVAMTAEPRRATRRIMTSRGSTGCA